MTGIRAGARFTAPDVCPVVGMTTEAETTVDAAVSSVRVTAAGECIRWNDR